METNVAKMTVERQHVDFGELPALKMKSDDKLTLTAIGVAASARAQWVVYDPTLHTQSFLNTAQEIAKFVEMINNQVQQTQTFADQLNEFPVRVHRRDSPPRRVGGTDRRDDR